MNLKINSIEFKTSGKTKADKSWSLYKVNKKYTYFNYGVEPLPFGEGDEINCDIEVQKKGEYTNEVIKLKEGLQKAVPKSKVYDKKRDCETIILEDQVVKGLREIYKVLAEIRDTLQKADVIYPKNENNNKE